jgi:virginiamycin B lyase
MPRITCLLAALVPAALATSLTAQEPGSDAGAAAPHVQEWPVPWPDTRPRDPAVAADGSVWFVGQTGNYLARFDPASERFERYELPEGTRPHTVVVAPDGTPWIAGNGNGTILNFDRDSSSFRVITVPRTEGVRTLDPHTFAFDGRGGLWFTMQRGNAIGHLGIADESIRIAKVATPAALPYGIVATPQGDAWAVLFGSNRLAHISRDTLTVREVVLPRERTRPRRLALDADGGVWYVDFLEGQLGRHDPASGQIREWPAPSEKSGPYAMAADDKGLIWFVETFIQPNRLVAFDPDSERFVHGLDIPSGGRVVRHMVFDAGSRSLWFGTDTHTLARARLP